MFKIAVMQRLQLILVSCTILLALYYAFVYRPLAKQAAALDLPLTNLWQKLPGVASPGPDGPDLFRIHEEYENARESLDTLHRGTRTISAQVAVAAELGRRLREPFQLIDFQNERENRLAELERLVRQQQVSMDKTVTEAFPEHTAETKEPGLLWIQLAAAHQLVVMAARSKVSEVHRLQVLPARKIPEDDTFDPLFNELPFQVELVGPMSALAQFLSSLPRRADELKALGLPPVAGDKLPFFVQGIILRKQSAQKPEQVTLEARVVALLHFE